MVSEPVKENLLEANAYLKQAEQLGNDERVIGLCVMCNGTLDSINVFVHDDDQYKLINEKNKELNNLFNKEFNKRTGEIKETGAYIRHCLTKQIERELMLWKAEQKFNFYDFLTKKYDL